MYSVHYRNTSSINRVLEALSNLGYDVKRFVGQCRFAPDLEYEHNGVVYLIKVLDMQKPTGYSDILPYTSMGRYSTSIGIKRLCIVSSSGFTSEVKLKSKGIGLILHVF